MFGKTGVEFMAPFIPSDKYGIPLERYSAIDTTTAAKPSFKIEDQRGKSHAYTDAFRWVPMKPDLSIIEVRKVDGDKVVAIFPNPSAIYME